MTLPTASPSSALHLPLERTAWKPAFQGRLEGRVPPRPFGTIWRTELGDAIAPVVATSPRWTVAELLRDAHGIGTVAEQFRRNRKRSTLPPAAKNRYHNE